MKPTARRCLGVIVCCAALVLGCDRRAASPTPVEQPGSLAPASGAIEQRIGTYMPPLEGGALEIAAPKGWDWVRPGSPYLVAFTPAKASINDLPRILITAEASPYADIEDVDSGNVDQLLQIIALTLADEPIDVQSRSVLLGGRNWVEFVTLRRSRNVLVYRLVVETVVRGRRYEVRLEATERQLGQHREAAYAVAASCRFSSDAGVQTDGDARNTEEPLAPPVDDGFSP